MVFDFYFDGVTVKTGNTRFQTKTAQKPYPLGRHIPHDIPYTGEYPPREMEHVTCFLSFLKDSVIDALFYGDQTQPFVCTNCLQVRRKLDLLALLNKFSFDNVVKIPLV